MTTNTNTNTPHHPLSTSDDARIVALVRKRLAKQSFATLSTISPAGNPHGAGVIYEAVDTTLWIHTLRSSRKARNVAASGTAAVCIPFRTMPFGPPFTIHFQAEAALVDDHAPEVSSLIDAGKLKRLTGHGELDMEDGCFVRLRPTGRVHSFGLGAKMLDLARDPIGTGMRTVEL